MNELASILGRWRGGGRAAADGVLATVVHVRGSAYRRPGARMLLLADGTRIGTISGGCLETDVARRAWWWTDTGAAVRIFDNTVEDAARDFGLGCNGVITVLLERCDTRETARLLGFLDQRQGGREACVVATVVRSGDLEAGAHFLFDANGHAAGPAADRSTGVAADAPADILEAARVTARERHSRLLRRPDGGEVFVEWIPPPQRLFVFGAGLDAAPVVAMASMMGWSVTVADTHASSLQSSRFPAAERLATLASDCDISGLGLTSADAVVVMTHNFPQDALLVPQLLDVSPCYLGLLGPRSRAEKLFDQIGARLDAGFIHAPVGLDIGGDQPEGIALSIVAEIQCSLSGQQGGRLRLRSGAIHAPALETGRPCPPASWTPEQTVPVACGLAHG